MVLEYAQIITKMKKNIMAHILIYLHILKPKFLNSRKKRKNTVEIILRVSITFKIMMVTLYMIKFENLKKNYLWGIVKNLQYVLN